MKVRDVIKRLEEDGWLELEAATGSTFIRRSREQLPLRAIRQWTFRPER
jgi:predicted RNA binding protein YcfA (HicA-like mRNA interferase family)